MKYIWELLKILKKWEEKKINLVKQAFFIMKLLKVIHPKVEITIEGKQVYVIRNKQEWVCHIRVIQERRHWLS